MRRIGEYQGYTIYWTPPQYDGGSGSGEVMVGSDSIGTARSESEAMSMAKRHVDTYLGKMGR